MLKFVKIATEGPKFAESARGTGTFVQKDVEPAAHDLAFFWSTIISSAQAFDPIQFTPAGFKGNMVVTGPGLTSLAVLAYELFRSDRARELTPAARLDAMKKIGFRNWSRAADEWRLLGLVENASAAGATPKYVIRGAGASSARILTAHLMAEAGLRERDTPLAEITEPLSIAV